MNLDWLNNSSQREKEQFKNVCNQLLSKTFIVRSIYKAKAGRVNNPDYTFLTMHYDEVREYLAFLDWDLRKDDLNGFFYVLNTDESNRLNFDKKETAIILALRLLYDENQERLGINQDALCTVRDVLEKVVTDYAILPAKPNMEEVKRTFTLLENHAIVQRIEGKFNQPNCTFTILPTIMSVVPSDKLNLVVRVLRKEDEDEKTEEDSFD